MGLGYYFIMKNNGVLAAEAQGNVWAAIVIIPSFTSGSALVMWLGEQITEFGIGNGISMILFAGIVARMPVSIVQSVQNIMNGTLQWWVLLLVVLGALALIILVVFVNDAERRIPVQYAKRVVGRKMYGGQSSNLPLKLNMSGVMPIIFANSIVALPATIGAFFTNVGKDSWLYGLKGFFEHVTQALDYTSPIYLIIFIALIIAFSYFYFMISFNPVEVANNIRNNGGSIPGIRPGKPTVDYITKILNRVTLIGGLFLCVVSGLPLLITIVVNFFSASGAATLSELAFGGSSLLIVVGVALETVRELEAQITLRNYKGFLD
jgi:preprotein translocase subunit SecY